MLFNSGVGIDIRPDRVNLVYLKGSFKGVKLCAASSFAIDAQVRLIDQIEALSGRINQFLKESNVSASGIYLGVSGNMAMLREIEFPAAVKENLGATLTYEMDKYIPLSIDDIYFDYQVIAEQKAEEKIRVLLTAVKKETLDPYLTLVDRLDQGVTGIEIMPAALANFHLARSNGTFSSALIRYSDEAGAELVIVRNRALVYAKTLSASDISEDGKDYLTPIRNRFFEVDQKVPLIDYTGNTNGAPVNENLFEQTTFTGPLPFDLETRMIPAYALALKGIKTLPVQMNLMPHVLRKKPDLTGFYLSLILSVMLCFALIGWGGSRMITQRQQLARMNDKLAGLQNQAGEVASIQSEITRMQGRLAYLRSLVPGNVRVIEILDELSVKIPKTAWVRNVKLSGSKLTLYGTAQSASELIYLLEESPLFENVEFLSTIRKGRDDQEVFRIGTDRQ